ncbi:sensor histidine kinase [Nocardia camponoti]|uniref:histidine kinase n=1 Tax=Nocardia camponoti TaxID=1616106 RepID=A0A917QNG3_9NOCA|nr:sensor histidine kinase [Nocardia camponoti]GGK60170.1 hypothetical protein GCM10011591_35600 [Nocardia camponoti]
MSAKWVRDLGVRRAYPVLGVGYLAFVWPLPVLLGWSVGLWQAVGLFGWTLALIGLAEWMRQRHAVARARQELADAVEAVRRAEQLRVVSEERLAIAREAGDALAQSISLINAQSSVGLELFDRKPAKAAAALATIKTTSNQALAELHSLLPAIRTEPATQVAADSDEPLPPPAQREPTPTLDDLPSLVDRTRASGLAVDTKVIGMPKQLPGVIDVAAARIIQESLANVARHAPGADALITLRYSPESLDITVDNSRPLAPPSAATRAAAKGNGIIAMRERAHALGGALTAGPRPSGGFRVAARLPARPAVVEVHEVSA